MNVDSDSEQGGLALAAATSRRIAEHDLDLPMTVWLDTAHAEPPVNSCGDTAPPAPTADHEPRAAGA